jgi:LuxR family maltose regulon positive regulatory protein
LERIAQASARSGNVLLASLVFCSIADEYQKQGQLRQARDRYQQALDAATDALGRPLPVAGKAMIGLADLAMEWNNLDAAERLLNEGIALCEQVSQLSGFNGYLTMVQVCLARENFDGAQAAIDRLQKMALQFDITDLDDQVVAIIETRFKILRGDLESARIWAKKRGLYDLMLSGEIDTTEDFNTSRIRKYEYPVLARLWLAESRFNNVLDLFQHVLPQVEKMDRVGLVIEMEVLRAIAHRATGETSRAFSALEHALNLAEPEGFVRLFVDEGEPLRSLLLEYRMHTAVCLGDRPTILLRYVDRLLAAFSPPAVHRLKSNIVEPLSERERDVLRLLPSALSTTDMAAELVISVNTLRTHLKSIYGKLGVHSRYEAIERAKELDLL